MLVLMNQEQLMDRTGTYEEANNNWPEYEIVI